MSKIIIEEELLSNLEIKVTIHLEEGMIMGGYHPFHTSSIENPCCTSYNCPGGSQENRFHTNDTTRLFKTQKEAWDWERQVEAILFEGQEAYLHEKEKREKGIRASYEVIFPESLSSAV
jgi:hypothetical protein